MICNGSGLQGDILRPVSSWRVLVLGLFVVGVTNSSGRVSSLVSVALLSLL
jgi:hypothetical protein